MKDSKKIRFYILLLLLIIPAFYAVAQIREYSFEHISLDDGLSQSIVKVIHRDKMGFMWFGTESGLNRYDGYEFKVYKHNPFDSTSISNDNIFHIAESNSGTIWISTLNGLNRFDRERDCFIQYRHDPRDSTSLSHDTVHFSGQDKHGNYWVVTAAGGIDRLIPGTKKFVRYRHVPGDDETLPHNYLNRFYIDHSDRLWLATDDGICYYDHKSDAFIRYDLSDCPKTADGARNIVSLYEPPSEPGILYFSAGGMEDLKHGSGLCLLDISSGKIVNYSHVPGNPRSISSNTIFNIREDKNGNLWLATARGMNRFDRDSRTFEHILIEENASQGAAANIVPWFHIDRFGNLWLGTFMNNGVYHIDTKAWELTHYSNDPADPNSLSNNTVMSVYESKEGTLWLGTNTGGISKVNFYARKFDLFRHIPGDPNSLSDNLVRSFCVDHKGYLWVGVASGGLNRYDPQRKNVTHFLNSPGNPRSLSGNWIWSLCEDRDGAIWAGTLNNGLNRFDRKSGTFKRYVNDPENPNSLPHNRARVIYEDHRGMLWIGTDGGGLSRFAKKVDTFENYQYSVNDSNSISHDFVRAITQDSKGVLWIGTFGGGLNKFDPYNSPEQGFIRYMHNPNDEKSLSNNTIQSIYVDREDQLWIGTFGGGLNRFDQESETFTHFTEQNSDLPNNVIYGVLGDDSGNIWVSSNRGLTEFNPVERSFKNYDVDDGLQSKEFNGQACFRSEAGEMFFGGIAGFNAFHPDSIRDNPYVPEIAIVDFQLFNESVLINEYSPLKKHILETDEIRLAHNQNDISFEFVALHYNLPRENRYSYILANYDKAWRSSGNQRTATYTNLEPGEYVFRVRGSNNDGVWNKKGKSIRILISPPWWQSLWAYLAYSGTFIVLLGVIHRIQKRRVIRNERNRATIREAELRAQAAEAQARAVQAENERKTHELEEARKLQLSMLPKKLPNVPDLEIAVHMQTATEVGGDYYDFYLDKEGDLTVVVGDATGHGLNAGTMVSVIKSLFVANVPESDAKSFFLNCTKTIKQLRLGNLYMAMMLVKFKNSTLCASSAGMPPIYIYRHESKSVEEILLRGMPLGAFPDYVYEDVEIKLNEGDTILLLSDGLIELFNNKKEMFDYHRVKQTLAEIGDRGPEEIINEFINIAQQWRQGDSPNDDITLVVLKKKR